MTVRTLPLVSVVALMLAPILAPGPALAQQAAVPPPPQEPILRIDSGMHTARINRIGVDAACTLLATGSYDKTVRLWRLPEGKLLRTLRLPIGPGFGGEVRSVTVAPDGSWVAAGGFDAAWATERSTYVYIFDAPSGALVARLGPLDEVIAHLAVSPDGRFLAAALHGGKGVRVWEKVGASPSAWRLVAEDKDYGGQDSYGAAFDRAGVLFTVAWDGKLRRYAPGFRDKPTSVETRGGRLPFSVAVHPSGGSVAVGLNDRAEVDVYDAATLAWRAAADTTIVTNREVSSVAWSADGRLLYAGGGFNLDEVRPILAWDWERKGRARRLDGTRDTILHVLPCGSGIALGAADPALGLLAADGSRVTWKEGAQADFRDQIGPAFSVAVDGRRVRFGLDQFGKRPVIFDLDAERIEDAPDQPGDLAEADTRSLPVVKWHNDDKPELGNTPIAVMPFELSRSLAIAPDRQQFVLGTEWALRSFDSTGKQLWGRQAPGIGWAVNIPRNGKVVLAGYADGTIRWHRLSDGEELLALFVHKEDKRWVAWTPKGYYMASPGGEALIGWHVNRDWDEAARFYPVDRFRTQFNRPDVVKLVLETLDEDKAIAQATRGKGGAVRRAEVDVLKSAPPIVTIQSPADGGSFRNPQVTIEYNVFSPTGAKITGVQRFVNNKALRTAFALPVDHGKFTFFGKETITLGPEDATVCLVAQEGERSSEPACVTLRWGGPKPGQVALPRLRALFVGVDAYTSDKLNPLKYAAKDARDLSAFFAAQEGKSFSKVESKLLTDAKRLEVIRGLDWLQKGSEEGDLNLLFLAGHGATIDQDFYFMTTDSDPDDAYATAVNRENIQRAISRRKGTMLVLLDACRSGAGADITGKKSAVDMNRVPNELGDTSNGVLLYASASARQYSYEGPEWGNGAFTRAVLDGLGGAADYDKNGVVETDELYLYVRRRVGEMTKSQQEPVWVRPNAARELRLSSLK
jgi:WD40 repeat protein